MKISEYGKLQGRTETLQEALQEELYKRGISPEMGIECTDVIRYSEEAFQMVYRIIGTYDVILVDRYKNRSDSVNLSRGYFLVLPESYPKPRTPFELEQYMEYCFWRKKGVKNIENAFDEDG